MADTTAITLINRFGDAQSTRSNWESLWQDVVDLVIPGREFITQREPGQRTTNRIFNATAPRSAVTLTSAIHGLFVNPTIRWFELIPVDPFDEMGMLWLYDSTSRMLAYFNDPASGFATASYEIALDLVGFGTGINQMTEPLIRTGIMRFIPRRLMNFYITEDEQGVVFEVIRRAEMTATDIMRFFKLPTDNIPSEIEEAANDSKKAMNKRDVLHVTRRRDNADPLSPKNTNMPWASFYVDVKSKTLIREGGFRENPYLTPRWAKSPEETYGRSPSIDMMPDIRMVNAISRTLIQAGELAARPPIAAFANSIEGNLATRPGAFWWIKRGTPVQGFPREILTGANLQASVAMREQIENAIEQGYFIDVLKLPTAGPGQGQPRMTAAEVATRRQQGLLLASPVMSRLYSEWLMPAIFRVFHWMFRTNRLAPAPASMAGRTLTARFTSPMAVAQRSSESLNFLEAVRSSGPLIELDPGVLARNVDIDEAFRKLWTNNNADPSMLRSEQEVAARKRQEEQALEAQQQAQLAETAGGAAGNFAGALKDLSGAR